MPLASPMKLLGSAGFVYTVRKHKFLLFLDYSGGVDQLLDLSSRFCQHKKNLNDFYGQKQPSISRSSGNALPTQVVTIVNVQVEISELCVPQNSVSGQFHLISLSHCRKHIFDGPRQWQTRKQIAHPLGYGLVPIRLSLLVLLPRPTNKRLFSSFSDSLPLTPRQVSGPP